MNILIISYHSLDYDGRLNELIKVAERLGEVFLFSLPSKRRVKNYWEFSEKNYLKYVLGILKEASNLPPMELILVDGRKAIIPARLIRKKLHCNKLVLDCREMDFPEHTKHFCGKVGCYIEKPCIKSAEIVIAANEERAEIMQDRYKLERKPLVFKNIRELKFDDLFDQEKAKEKFSFLFNTKSIKVISTAGCFSDRLTSTLVENFDKVKANAELYLVGSSSKEEEDIIRKIIKRKKLKNVYIMGRVNQSELKFLIRNCHVGIVGYHQRTPNYKYCASGKIYEFMFERIPVVTTTNPPLKKMCEVYGIGVPDDTFYIGINKVLGNYRFYKSNVEKFLSNDIVENNIEQLVNKLHGLIR